MNNPDVELITVPCPKCNASTHEILFEGQDYLYGVPGKFFASRCLACGLTFQNPQPSPSSIKWLYPDNYIPHINFTSGKASPVKPGMLSRLIKNSGLGKIAKAVIGISQRHQQGIDLVPQFIAGGRLLEIGCADGSRLVTLKKQGWTDLHGIELVESAAAKARSFGFDIKCGAVEEKLAEFPDHSLDVIVTSMVLEHLFDPFKVLKEIIRKLKPGGQLLFSTICIESYDAKEYGRYWGGFDFPRHMVYFRKQDLLEVLHPAFENIQTYHQVAPQDFVRSSTWRTGENLATSFDQYVLKNKDSRRFLLFNILLAKRGKTTRISVIARKKNKTTD